MNRQSNLDYKKGSEAMSKKTTNSANAVSNKSASESKRPAAPVPSPNSQTMSEEAVRLCAYRKWEAAGRPSGDCIQFWLQAEKELSKAK